MSTLINVELQLQCIIHYIGKSTPLILEGPSNTTIKEGEKGLYVCSTNGSNTSSQWYINGTLYSPSTVPPGHWWTKNGLLVLGTKNTNMTSYQCVVHQLNDQMEFTTVKSDVAVLTVEG